jgi:hypothetical protein
VILLFRRNRLRSAPWQQRRLRRLRSPETEEATHASQLQKSQAVAGQPVHSRNAPRLTNRTFEECFSTFPAEKRGFWFGALRFERTGAQHLRD